ncbi:MAG: SRPBCC family protein [Actinomycetota bacterium]|nr:SRPBCC family protein [Actinomycetota bacterium]
MQLEHTFTVPVGVEDAWLVLLDIERIAPCMPGAVIDSVDGDNFTGSVKVKLGPIGLTYKGKASFIEKDEAAHRAVIDARGRDSRGSGTANAKVTATLREVAGGTEVVVVTDLDITGKPAQFGRGVMVDVGNKLIGQFADCLAGKLSAGAEPVAAESAEAVAAAPDAPGEPAVEPDEAVADVVPADGSAPAAAPAHAAAPDTSSTPPAAERPTAERPKPSPVPRRTADQVEPIDLIGSAGPAVAKRLVPLVVAALLLVLALRWRRRS